MVQSIQMLMIGRYSHVTRNLTSKNGRMEHATSDNPSNYSKDRLLIDVYPFELIRYLNQQALRNLHDKTLN